MGRTDGQTNLAEAGTLSMEFTTLGRLTGRADFFDAGMAGWYALMASRNVSGVRAHICRGAACCAAGGLPLFAAPHDGHCARQHRLAHSRPAAPGLHCVGLSTARGDCYLQKLSLGSAADSTYEYMLKQWVLSGKAQGVPLMLYKEAMGGMRK